jgi:hypothetical protein
VAAILGSAGTASATVKETLKVVRAVWKRMAEGEMTATVDGK